MKEEHKFLVKNILLVFLALVIVMGVLYLSVFLSVEFNSVMPFLVFFTICVLSLWMIIWSFLWDRYINKDKEQNLNKMGS